MCPSASIYPSYPQVSLLVPQMGPLHWLPLTILMYMLLLYLFLKNIPGFSATPPTPPQGLPHFWAW